MHTIIWLRFIYTLVKQQAQFYAKALSQKLFEEAVTLKTLEALGHSKRAINAPKMLIILTCQRCHWIWDPILWLGESWRWLFCLWTCHSPSLKLETEILKMTKIACLGSYQSYWLLTSSSTSSSSSQQLACLLINRRWPDEMLRLVSTMHHYYSGLPPPTPFYVFS